MKINKMKGYDIQNRELGSADPSGVPVHSQSRDSVPPPPLSSFGNSFLEDDELLQCLLGKPGNLEEMNQM